MVRAPTRTTSVNFFGLNRVESISFHINSVLVLICCFIIHSSVVLNVDLTGHILSPFYQRELMNVGYRINLGVNGSIKFISIVAWVLYRGNK